MRNLFIMIIALCLSWACQNDNSSTLNQDMKPSDMLTKTDIKAPICKKVPKELEKHGYVRIDDYYWLKEREDTEVIDYLNQENAYREKMMEHTKKFQDKLYEEIIARIKKDDISVPYKENGYFRYTRYEKGKEYAIHCRKKENLDADEDIILDANEMAKDHEYYNAGGLNISPDNRLMVFGEDTVSRRIYHLRFKDLNTGEFLPDIIPNTTGYAVWGNDNKTIFYTAKDETLRGYKIYRHVLGQEADKDDLVFEEKDNTFSCFVYKSKSKKYIIIGSFQTLSSEYRILDANNPSGEFVVFQPRERDHEYSIAHYDDKFYIRTNLNAKNFKLMSTPENATLKENWNDVIPHRNDVFFEGMDIFKNYLVLAERIKGITNLRVRSWDGKKDHYIDFGEDTYLAYTSVNPEFDTDVLRLGYQSLTTPNSIFDYEMNKKELELLKQQEVLGDFSSQNYSSERIYIKARDGVEVPVSIVYRNGFKKDGKAPCLLYAYGSYGASMEPYFSSVRLSLLDRGFVYAIAHIRGGQELGRHWYEDGKLLKKKNTFTDYIDCAKGMVELNYTNTDKLFAMGGSAGGLLMGAVVNMEPSLFKGVVAAVPFVDVITTMLDESIPLTTGEYDEWGNPNKKEYYDYILSYSPYDNVESKEYPPMLVTTGLHDSQVQYWEPAKWVAKMREYKTDSNPLLLYCNMDTGHGGASGRFEKHKETAMEYAFMLDLAGLNNTFLN